MRGILSFIALSATLCLSITDLHAQGRPRGNGGGDQSRQRDTPRNDSAAKPTIAPVTDPMLAIEREMTSLRIDLKLTPEQAPLFDGLDREVRNAARASRDRTRQLSAFRLDDGSTVAATSIIGTIAEADMQRGEAMRQVSGKLDLLLPALTPEQRKQFDRRIVQAMREPLGNS
ncbi:MAG: Spy/CpxP family protein refolding chaperone [Betaproteobacteria bacterium]